MTQREKNKTKARIFALMTELDWLFDYKNYDRGVVFEKQDEKHLAAKVVEDREYQRITIHIYPSFFTESLENQRDYILHEFCHTFTHSLQQIAYDLLNGKLQTEPHIHNANEEATSRITRVISALLEGKKQFARKAFAEYIKK